MNIIVCAKCGAKNRVDTSAAADVRPVCGRCGAALEAGNGSGAAAAGGATEKVTDQTFASTVLGSGATPVLVDFWAEWCGPCRMIAPALDQLAAESSGRYRIAKLNVDENPQTSSQYGVRSIPTLIIFKGGKEVDRLIGALPKSQIAARLAAQA